MHKIQDHDTLWKTLTKEATMALLEFSNDREYQRLCEEMSGLLTQEKDLASRKATLKDELIKIAGEPRKEFGIKLSVIEKKGSIDYKKAMKELGFTQEELEPFRKESVSYWEVRKY